MALDEDLVVELGQHGGDRPERVDALVPPVLDEQMHHPPHREVAARGGGAIDGCIN